MQNIKLPRRKEWGEQASSLLSFIFLQHIIPFQLSPISTRSPPFLRNVSRWHLILLLSFTIVSLFLNCPKSPGRRRWERERGKRDQPAPHASAPFKQFGKSGRGALQIMLNVINLSDSWKSDMRELQRNLFYFAMKCFCIMRKKMSSVP